MPSGPCYGSGVTRVNLPGAPRKSQGLITVQAVSLLLCSLTLNQPLMRFDLAKASWDLKQATPT